MQSIQTYIKLERDDKDKNIKDIYPFLSNSFRTVPCAIWKTSSEFFTFCNLFHEPLGELIYEKYEKPGKYLPILHEATCTNYFIVKSLLKPNLTNCTELA